MTSGGPGREDIGHQDPPSDTIYVYSAMNADVEDLRRRLDSFTGQTSEIDAVVALIEDCLATRRAALAGTPRAADALSGLAACAEDDATLRSAQVAGIGYHFRSMGLKDLDAAAECLVQSVLLLRPLAAQNRGIFPDLVMRIYGVDPRWVTQDWRPALTAVGTAMVAAQAGDPVWVTMGIALIRETLRLPPGAGRSAASGSAGAVPDPQQIADRSSLGAALGQRYRLTRSPADAEEALSLALACLEQASAGVVDPGLLDFRASIAYRDHFDISSDPGDRQRWLEHAHAAVLGVAADSPDRDAYLVNLQQAEQSGQAEQTDHALHSDQAQQSDQARQSDQAQQAEHLHQAEQGRSGSRRGRRDDGGGAATSAASVAGPSPVAASPRKAAVRAVARQIDRWVEQRPRPLHHLREVLLPSDPSVMPEQLMRLLDRAFPVWRRHRSVIEMFRVWTREDALLIDTIFLEPARQELLSATDTELERAFGDIGADSADTELVVTRLYGRTQELLWMEHCGQLNRIPRDAWADLLGVAQSCRGLSDDLPSAAEFLDATIRLQLVRGVASRVLGRTQDCEVEFTFLISWYAHAASLGLNQVVRARKLDWLDALYALLDSAGGDRRDSIVCLTATVLVKELSIGRFRVLPPLTLGGAYPHRVVLEGHSPFATPEWQQAVAHLGTDTAFLDLVITEKTLQIRVHRAATSWIKVIDLAGMEGVEARWFSVDGSVLEPSLDTELTAAAQATAYLGAEPPAEESSSRFVWNTHHQAMTYAPAAAGWSWSNRWTTMLPNPTRDIWKAVERIALREAVSYCESGGVTHLVISPDGSLGAVPFHLVPRPDLRRLGDTHRISYMPNLAGMLTLLDRDRLDLDRLSAVVVQDPSGTVGHATWECDRVLHHVGPSATTLDSALVTAATVRTARSRIDLFHFTGHAQFDWQDPEGAFLDLGQGRRMGLDDLRQMPFGPGSLAFLSACHTARRGTARQNRTTSHGLVSSLLEAGAATVVCTMWPVESAAAALVANWFYEAWLGPTRLGRLDSLQSAVESLRSTRKADCEEVLGSRIYIRGEYPFQDEYFWGAFVLYGAW